MKSIGIKLADGSFYPVLQEGSVQTKQLDLTTANNNQTKVMVDLYRSESCSMEDAEYVDSLQIENLIEHPNGETDISFTVSIDENNQLNAQIVDTETGNSSNTAITLVSRTIEERLTTDEFGITDSDEPEMEETGVSEDEVTIEEEEIPETPSIEVDATETIADDFNPSTLFEDQNQIIFDDIETDDANAEDFEESEISIPKTDITEETEITQEEDVFAEQPEITQEADVFADMDLDQPASDVTITEENDFTLNEQDFDLPDFEETTSNEDFGLDMNNDIFNDNENLDFGDTFDDSDNMAAAGGISFTGLYDKETELGDSSVYDEDETKKKTKVPVIICVICAIICIIAVLLILFVIPSRCNLLTRNSNSEANTETVIEAPVQNEEPAAEPEPAPVVPEAKEDEVIVIEKAEEVVPVQPEPAEVKPENITYKIKWGDTLWDIAGTYYKNPWKYKYIARYNGIKNPDHIISGTTIIIPAE